VSRLLLSTPNDRTRTLNKTQLVSALARRTGLPQDEVRRVLDALFDEVLPAEFEAGNAVAIRGFGTFEPRLRAPRLGRNPSTGAPVQVPARMQVVLKPARR